MNSTLYLYLCNYTSTPSYISWRNSQGEFSLFYVYVVVSSVQSLILLPVNSHVYVDILILFQLIKTSA